MSHRQGFLFYLVVEILLAGLTSHARTRSELARSTAAPNRVRIWHVTDFHHAPTIKNGDQRIYCHRDGKPSMEPGGQFGSFGCDTPSALMESAIDAMWKLESNPDFILWTGDTAPHLPDSWTNQSAVVDVISKITAEIESRFPQIPLYASYGNHDYWPTDQFPTGSSEIYEHFAKLWSKHLNDTDAERTLRNHGYYALRLARPQNTLLLSLNTILWYNMNNASSRQRDPGDQFLYLEQKFQEARKTGLKVMVVSHIPPGRFWANTDYCLTAKHNRRFLSILSENADIISGLYFGHLHRDLFMLLKNTENQFVKPILVAPALTPCYDPDNSIKRNPAIRYMELDPVSGDLRVLRQYYLDLALATREAQRGTRPKWAHHYSWEVPRGETSMQFFMRKLKQLSNTEFGFEEYLNRVFVNPKPRPSCDSECRSFHLCAIQEMDFDNFDKCVKHHQQLTAPANSAAASKLHVEF